MLRRVAKALLLTATVTVVLVTLLWSWRKEAVIGAAMLAAGRSECPASQVLSAGKGFERIGKSMDRIEQGLRKIASDGELGYWEVPGSGRFWVRGPFRRANTFVFAEMQNEIYYEGDVRVRTGDTVLDCGADFGSFTRAALNAGAAKVLAIEIDPTKRESLRRTFSAEIAEGRVAIVPFGVWDGDGEVELTADSVVLATEGLKQKVPVTTIDRIVADAKVGRVDFIKFDVEGAEKRALAGAKETLRRFKPRLAFAAEHYPDDSIAIPRIVRGIVPAYVMSCAHCRLNAGRFVPEMIYFR